MQKTIIFFAFLFLALALPANISGAATAQDLDKDSSTALARLYKKKPVAAVLGQNAKAILIFPSIVKAGVILGGSYGEGVLRESGKTTGYYNTASGSWGLQLGAQSYGYALFLMTDKALQYVRKTKGWEIGVGPTVVMVDDGVAKNLSTSTLKDDAYAFIFNQQGLMAGVSIEGSKVTKIKR